MTELNIQSIINWLQENISQINYGEVSVTFFIHAGRVKRLIKTVNESELIQ